MHIVVLITTKNVREANKIATKLIDGRLIACANVVKGVKSIFSWKGKIDKADEVLLILKSKKECFSKIFTMVKKYHSYETPEVIAIPVIGGSKDYLDWIDESVD